MSAAFGQTAFHGDPRRVRCYNATGPKPEVKSMEHGMDPNSEATFPSLSVERRILSFSEYLQAVRNQPGQLRNATSYLRDCMLHFGTDTIHRHGRPWTRYRLFDAPFDPGLVKLIGHEPAQNAFFSFLQAQAEHGRAPRLFLFHGPNGSAKSTFFQLLASALEAYSATEQGALYRFNWIFPAGPSRGRGIGFSETAARTRPETGSYAHLDGESIDALLPDEFRDSPLLLIPREHRLKFLADLLGPDTVIPPWLDKADLHPRNRQIFDTLLLSSASGPEGVLRHVQVERFTLSRRYRRGLVTVEPKMTADAHARQITADRSLQSLPPALQNLELYRYGGDLVDANRGMVEFADLLKRPLEGFKYLITTLEEGFLSLDDAILQFDLFFGGSANDRQFLAFSETPDFASFEGRCEFARMPYLLDYHSETNILELSLAETRTHKPIAPHVLTCAGLWAVMTRLVRPQPAIEGVDPRLVELNVIEKALWYGDLALPESFTSEQVRTALSQLPEFLYQQNSELLYEGGIGASPRLLRTILLRALTRPEHAFCSVTHIFTEIEQVMKQKATFEFVNYPGQEGGYHDLPKILTHVRRFWQHLMERDLWEAANLVELESVLERLENYISLVIHFVKKEKIKDAVTGQYHSPSEAQMKAFEAEMDINSGASEFRQNCMSRVAAFSIEQPGEKLNLKAVFAPELDRVFHRQLVARRTHLADLCRTLLEALESGAPPPRERAEWVEATRARLETRGYFREAAMEMLEWYVREYA